MEVRLLGPVGVWLDGDTAVPVPSGKPLACLAVLALAGGRSVTAGQLVEAVWGDEVREGVGKSLQVHLSRLRGALRPAGVSLRHTEGGYLLDLPHDGWIDAARFAQLCDTGLADQANGQPARAARVLGEALGLWRGPALAGLEDVPFAAAEAERLHHRLLTARTARLAAELDLGMSTAVVDELRELAAEHPYDERLHALLVTALYRAGDQTAALAALRSIRERLDDDMGLEPSPELIELERQVLQHAGALRPPARPTRQDNLVAEVTSFIGREVELDELETLLARGRMSTVCGPGGIGKTRVALRLAARSRTAFPDGVWLVELGPVADPRRVAGTIGASLSTAPSGLTDLDSLVDYLIDRRTLLVLDNCEHVIDEVAAVAAAVLRRCPDVHLLATSREPLEIAGERVYRLPPMTSANGSGPTDAARLFAERAQAHRRDVELERDGAVIERICARVDGLPLAVEMAAARLRSESLVELSAALELQLAGLASRGRDIDRRHQTLTAVIDWSYQLLSAPEQECFRRLGVFAGGWTRDSAREVADVDGETLSALVDKSLVEYHAATQRFRLLEPIRHHARARAADDPSDRARTERAHAEHFLTIAETSNAVLELGGDQAAAMDVLLAEMDNVRAAIDTLTRTDPVRALRITAAMRPCWDIRGLYVEGAEQTERAIAAARADGSATSQPRLLGFALVAASDMRQSLEQGDAARAHAIETQQVAAACQDPDLIALGELLVAESIVKTGDAQSALRQLAGLRLESVSEPVRLRASLVRGYCLVVEREFAAARELLESAYLRMVQSANDWRLLGAAVTLSAIEIAESDLEAAVIRLESVREIAVRMRATTHRSYIDINLGLATAVAGDLDAAVGHYRDALAEDVRSLEVPVVAAAVLGHAMYAMQVAADAPTAARLHGFLDAVVGDSGRVTLDATELGLLEQSRAQTQACLGPAFDALAAAGRRLSPAEAAQLALELPLR